MLTPALPWLPARLLNLALAIAIALTPAASLAAPSAAPAAPAGPAQALDQTGGPLSVTKRDALAADTDGDGRADAGDTLRYTLAVSNTGASDAAGLSVADTLDPNTSLVPGSLQVSPLAFPDAAATPRDTPLSVAAPGLLANDTGSPAPLAAPFAGATGAGGSITVGADGGFSYTPPPGFVGADSFTYTATNPAGSDSSTVTIAVLRVASAADDAFTLANGSKLAGNLLANDDGDPALALLSFGDSLANVGAVPADGVSVLSLPAGGGTVEVTASASGVIRAESVGTAGSGAVAFFYAMQAGDGSADTAQVTIAYGDLPAAVDDTSATLGAAAYTTTLDTPLAIPAGAGLLSNDLLGAPAATLARFGGGDASPTADRPAGATLDIGGGGSLMVGADGGLAFTPPAGFTGVFAFQYRIDNGIGASAAAVEITVVRAPGAVDDAFQISLGALDSSGSATANDDRGAPPATIASFGGGSLGGVVADNPVGATVAIPGSGGITVSLAPGGALTVDATAGTAIPGVYSFDYRLDNSAGSDVATVALSVVQGPVARDDAFAFSLPAALSGDLKADNGSGVDTPGLPAYDQLTFGGGSLGGAVTDNAAGASAPFAGGALTVNLDGSFALTNATLPGVYTFQYRLASTALAAFDDATVTVTVQQAPLAQDDINLLAAVGATAAFGPGALFADNGAGADTLGTPAAALVSFGAGDITGSTLTTDFAAGATTGAGSFAGGALTVNADGSFSVSNPTAGGTFTFVYRIQNAAGFDDATATVTVQEGPVAQDDSFAGGFTSGPGGLSLSGSLFAANGGGPDILGNPSATLASFGGGSLGGTVASNAAGASATLAGGTLTVNSDGTFALANATAAGAFTFVYRITNAVGSDDATVTITLDAAPTVSGATPANGAVDVPPGSDIVVSFSEPVAVTAGGISVSCSVAGAVAGALSGSGTNAVTFNPSANLPGGETCTVTVAASGVADGDANDPPDTLDGDYSFSFQVAPMANDDAYTVTPHLTFESPAGVRGNDGPATATITGFGPTLATANGTVPNGTNTITAGGAGGRVVMSADGRFSYYPDAGDTSPATASFFYTIAGGDTAQVTLTFESEELLWFVDNTPGATVCTGANVGTQACPAATLAAVAAVDTPGDKIYLAAGSYAAGITLEAGEWLIGDGLSGNLFTFTGVSPAPGSSLPNFSGVSPVLTTTESGRDGIALATNNVIRGLTIGNVGLNGDADDISGANFGTLTMQSVALNGSGRALNLDNGTLAAVMSELASTGSAAEGVRLVNLAGTLTTQSTTISDSAGAGVSIAGSSAALSFGPTSVTRAGGVSISTSNTTGNLTFGATTIVTPGSSGIFLIGGSSTIQFGATTIDSGPGRGIGIADMTGGSVTFASATITRPGLEGVTALNNNAPVTISGGAITDAVGDSINLSGGNGNFTYAGTIDDDLGRLVAISNTTGGTKSFSGAISDGGDGDGEGIFLDTNTGATISFSGGLTLSTGASPAFRALGGGTVAVMGANNTIATTTATALNVADTTIGAAGLTFRSISSNGGSSTGIILDTTGSFGGLTVTGAGSPGSGGTIANKTGADGSTATGIGIYLNATTNVSLSWMQLNDFSNFAIHGLGVIGFALSNSVISGATGTSAGAGDAPIAFGRSNPGGANGLLGPYNAIIDTTIRGGIEHNLELYNQSSSFTLSVIRVTIRDNSVVSGSDGILAEMQGTASGTLVVSDSSFIDNKSQAFQGNALNSSSLNVSVTNATVTRNTQGNEGLVFQNASDADLTTLIAGNTITGFGGVSIFVGQTAGNATASSQLNATIIGNNVTAPPSATNHAILAFLTSSVGQQSRANVLISDNNVTQNSSSGTARAILVDTPDTSTSPNFNVTVAYNIATVTNSAFGVTPIAVQARQSAIACMNVANNTALFPGGVPAGAYGVRVRQVAPATAQLERGISASGIASVVLDDNHNAATTEALGTIGVVSNGMCSLPSLTASLPDDPAPAQAVAFPVNVGVLPAGKAVTISFDALIADPLPAAAAQVVNQATARADGLTDTLSDDPDTAAPGDPTITPLDGRLVTLHLPMVVRAAGLPDLVVERIVAEGGALQVVVRNQGAAPVSDPFWVDLYIAPEAPPAAVNQTWRAQGGQGATWGVTGAALPLAPGATLTLSLGGAYYRADLSGVAGPIAAGTALYAQVDSANTLTSYGGVLEAHEQAGGPYNNIAGPVAAAGLVAEPLAVGSLAGAGALPGLPARPAR